jgi:DHA2 family multidrug resistance protein-like MFS transporter
MIEPNRHATLREWMGLAVLALPTLLVSMDMTILYLALPSISAELHPTGVQLLWMSDIYSFVLAGVLIPLGAWGDRVGRRKLLLIGAAAFGTASVLAGWSQTAEQLIAARALLGFAGATLLPSTLSIIRSLFPVQQERTLAIGLWATCFTLGGVVGPLVAGVLLTTFHWGSVFFVAVPVMLVLLVMGPRLLPEVVEPSPARVDGVSVLQLLVVVFATTLAMKHAVEHGPSWLSAFLVAVAWAVGDRFTSRQRSLPHPLIDLGLFRNPAFAISVGANASALFAWVGASLLVAQHLQLVSGLAPMSAALWTLPGAAACVAGCLAAPALARRWWGGRIVTVGLLMAALGLTLLATGGGTGPAAVVPATMVLGFGVSLVVTLSTDIILTIAPPHKAGSASSLSETAADLGGAFGIAIMGSISLAIYRLRVELPGSLSAEQRRLSLDTLGGAVDIAHGGGSAVAGFLLDAARAAFGHGVGAAASLAALLTLCMAVLSWRSMGRRRLELGTEHGA